MNKDCASEIRCRVSFAVLSVSSAVSVLPQLLWELTITVFFLPFFSADGFTGSWYESCCQVAVLNAIFPHLARENSRKFQYIYSWFYLTWTHAKGIQDFNVIVAVPSSAPPQPEELLQIITVLGSLEQKLFRTGWAKMKNVETADMQTFRLWCKLKHLNSFTNKTQAIQIMLNQQWAPTIRQENVRNGHFFLSPELITDFGNSCKPIKYPLEFLFLTHELHPQIDPHCGWWFSFDSWVSSSVWKNIAFRLVPHGLRQTNTGEFACNVYEYDKKTFHICSLRCPPILTSTEDIRWWI